MSSIPPISQSLLAQLVAFDTTSRHSNLQLIEFVRDYLARWQIDSTLTFDDNKKKANLYATLGKARVGGVLLSGHTDVVPVDGQDWQSNPFQLSVQQNKLFGRGSTDMKGFIAVCLAFVPYWIEHALITPVHLAFSYDEEVGCLGVRRLIANLAEQPIKPRLCVIGEPTNMQVIRAHKGKVSVRCHVHGQACHSSLTHQGVNAVEYAAEVISQLKNMARRFRDEGPWDEAFDPPYTTVHTGKVQGGIALNIVPETCTFEFEFRYLPEQNGRQLLAEIIEYAERKLLPEMHMVAKQTGFRWEEMAAFASLDTAETAEIVTLAKQLMNTNQVGKVSFGTEGGLFQQAGISTVICGPGSIQQAHKPNEFITQEQLILCERFMQRLTNEVLMKQ
ncbi:acetylornithine deacetylase [Beggiatoa leptomitoformis]|uniref:Acetylornithine deacetylase n=1 Tax=Beggiatoa leptomitoformis TaxID=288004 RepID=A0A2N9YEW6_9GAMM|nr:acetylornithine deacetylase [Beggiatoa leptomitoformis]ALG68627.1 acetylornithine deacetylase [Beggiatoa leptomitoformis]AUI69027.1 acetylornithine deacetylase [Beggiatoa leptomitoformis]